MAEQTLTRIVIDTTRPGEAFPRLHEGRYEVDPVGNGVYPTPQLMIDNARRCGLKLLRVGVGVWLPSQDPDAAGIATREWFRGTTMADTDDASKYNFEHLDKTLSVCRDLGVDVVLSVDYMPASLADAKPFEGIPAELDKFAPGYKFPDGIRTAPPRDPEVFAAAALHLVRHVEASGVQPRYVELWNEPDLPFWWTATFDEFWTMYQAFARVISAAGYRVGGPSCAGLAESLPLWRDEFIVRAARDRVPLDFYSWHRYPTKPQRVIEAAREVREVLDRNGLRATESLIDEWGYDLGQPTFWATTAMAAFVTECIVGFADLGMRAQLGGLLADAVPVGGPANLGLFDRGGRPNPIFFAFEALERFQLTPRRLPLDGWPAAIAGTDDGGKGFGLVLANARDDEMAFRLELGQAVATGTARRLTQEGFDAARGWLPEVAWSSTDSEPLRLPPGSVLSLEAGLG